MIGSRVMVQSFVKFIEGIFIEIYTPTDHHSSMARSAIAALQFLRCEKNLTTKMGRQKPIVSGV